MKKLLLILCLLLIPLTAQGARTWPTSELILSEDSVIIKDEFLSGLLTTGSIGELGWNLTGTGSSITSTDTTRPGTIRITSGATTGNRADLSLKAKTTTTGMIDAASNWDLTMVVKISSSHANDYFVFGMSYSTDNSKFASFQLNTTTTWTAQNKESSTTSTNTSVTVNAGQWYKLRIHRSGSAIYYYVDDSLVATHTTNLPTGQFQPLLTVYTGNSVSRSVDIDYFSLRIPSLTR